MSNIEQQIVELERRLALVKAFQGVQISFGQGYKSFPEDVRNEVTEVLRAYAAEMAVKVEDPFLTEENSSKFSEEEITALKILAETVLAKTNKSTMKTDVTHLKNSAEVNREGLPKPVTTPTKGTLLLLDNLSISMKKKVQSGAEVRILEERANKFYVQDEKSNRFWIPQEDIDLQA